MSSPSELGPSFTPLLKSSEKLNFFLNFGVFQFKGTMLKINNDYEVLAL